MRQHFTVQGRFCSLNEFYRMHRYAQAKTKRDNDAMVAWSAKAAKIKPCKPPIVLDCLWIEPNKRRDIDNIHFGVKFILDGLVKAGILKDDARRYVEQVNHKVSYDKENPRIEVWIND